MAVWQRGGALVLACILACGAAIAQEPAPTERPRPPEGSRIINLPSADTPAKGTLGVLFTHRFEQPLAESDYQSFFSFDSGADIGLGLSYSPLDSLELSLDRSSEQDDYELAAKYRFLPFAEGRPYAFSLRVGGNARTEEAIEDRMAFFAQGIASVSLEAFRLPTSGCRRQPGACGDRPDRRAPWSSSGRLPERAE